MILLGLVAIGSVRADDRAWDRRPIQAAPVESAVAQRPATNPTAVARGPRGDAGVREASAEVPVSAADRDRPLPLAPPRDARQLEKKSDRSQGSQAFVTVLTSLAMVVGAFALVVWFTRRSLPSGLQRLPREVLQPLGRAPLDARQHLQLLKIGNKLLLVAVSQNGSETLTEITDPDEVHRLTGICEELQPTSVSNTFRQVLHQLGKEPASRGFLSPSAADGDHASDPFGSKQKVRDAP